MMGIARQELIGVRWQEYVCLSGDLGCGDHRYGGLPRAASNEKTGNLDTKINELEPELPKGQEQP
jgi:hypothetical protein